MKLIHKDFYKSKKFLIVAGIVLAISIIGSEGFEGEQKATPQAKAEEQAKAREFNEDNLTDIVHKVMGEKDGEEDTIESVSADSESGYARVVLRYTAFSEGTYKASLLDKAEQILKRTAGLEGMEFINMEFKGPFVDSYGNREFKPVMRVDMYKETLNKINFDNTIQLDRIADSYWQHPTMQD